MEQLPMTINLESKSVSSHQPTQDAEWQCCTRRRPSAIQQTIISRVGNHCFAENQALTATINRFDLTIKYYFEKQKPSFILRSIIPKEVAQLLLACLLKMFQPTTMISAQKNARSISMNMMQAPQIPYPNTPTQQQPYHPSNEPINHGYLYQPIPQQTITIRRFQNPQSNGSSMSPTRVRISSTDSQSFSGSQQSTTTTSSTSKIHQITRTSDTKPGQTSVKGIEAQPAQAGIGIPIQPFGKVNNGPVFSETVSSFQHPSVIQKSTQATSSGTSNDPQVKQQVYYKSQVTIPQRMRINTQPNINMQPPFSQATPSAQIQNHQPSNTSANKTLSGVNKHPTYSSNQSQISSQPSTQKKLTYDNTTSTAPQQPPLISPQHIQQPVRFINQHLVGKIIPSQGQSLFQPGPTIPRQVNQVPSPTKNVQIQKRVESPKNIENQSQLGRNNPQNVESGNLRVVLFQDEIVGDAGLFREQQKEYYQKANQKKGSRDVNNKLYCHTEQDIGDQITTEVDCSLEYKSKFHVLEKENKQLSDMVIVLERKIIEILASNEKDDSAIEQDDDSLLPSVRYDQSLQSERKSDFFENNTKKLSLSKRDGQRITQLEALLKERDIEITTLRKELDFSKQQSFERKESIDHLSAEIERISAENVKLKQPQQPLVFDSLKYSSRAEKSTRNMLNSTDLEVIMELEKKVQELVDENTILGSQAEKFKAEADLLKSKSSTVVPPSNTGSKYSIPTPQQQHLHLNYSSVPQPQGYPAYFQQQITTQTTRQTINSQKNLQINGSQTQLNHISNNQGISNNSLIYTQQYSQENNQLRNFDSQKNLPSEQVQYVQIQPLSVQRQQRFASVGGNKQSSYF